MTQQTEKLERTTAEERQRWLQLIDDAVVADMNNVCPAFGAEKRQAMRRLIEEVAATQARLAAGEELAKALRQEQDFRITIVEGIMEGRLDAGRMRATAQRTRAALIAWEEAGG